jgi:hypothetical protein
LLIVDPIDRLCLCFAFSNHLPNLMCCSATLTLFGLCRTFVQMLGYCIVRHTGFLVGYGDAAGDPAHHTQTIEQVIELLQTPPPWRRDLEPIYSSLAARKKPVDWPAPGSEIEDQLFAVCTLIFVNPTQSERALNALRQALGGKRCEYVLALLAFIRTAHFWTLVHPGIAMEDDVKELLGEYKVLAALLLQEPEPVPE